MSGIIPDDTAVVPPVEDRAGDEPRASKCLGLVVAIGASAGGLDACRSLVRTLGSPTEMSFILVQHLDPTHSSMLVELLADHTTLTVSQADDGMLIEREHLYVIPPGKSLTVADGALHLSPPEAPHGLRLPFDVLLHSMAAEFGERAACVVLSGTGGDGSGGLTAVKAAGGLVIAQDPAEAAYSGMPKCAIATGMVDFVLPIAEIAQTLAAHNLRDDTGRGARQKTPSGALAHLPDIIALIRSKTTHDFALYKQGTLVRRIERRMAHAGIGAGNEERYLKLLLADPKELDLLAKDLLINVTSFFRDPAVFDYLAESVIPDFVAKATADRPLRIWIAGCSTGEESYSLAMLFCEEIAKAGPNVKLQVFGSDVDADAVAVAREGLYPDSIASAVSPDRLERFFTREDHGYRVSPELRAMVVFTVQDVLADPPFSRLDLVSCRNLLIYLGPIAQKKVMALFHFALRERGLLLLGSSETAGAAEGSFEVASKSNRLFRKVGSHRPTDFAFPTARGQMGVQSLALPAEAAPRRQSELAELCRRMLLETFAPAAVLVNHKNECLYLSGPTGRFLTLAPGHPSHDILAMVRAPIRTKLRAAIQEAVQTSAPVTITGARLDNAPDSGSFSIDVRPVAKANDNLLLISFVDEKAPNGPAERRVSKRDLPRVAQIELELEGTRAELQSAIRSLEMSAEEQKVVNEEALSFNEEYQSTNEELLTSKEEMQSLNEELTALNSQLQETLERQRTTSNDLKNVLYSTDVATLFLDPNLNIRFFTPATRLLFNVIPGDIGRPLSDLQPLSVDGALLTDAQTVLRSFTSVEREVETRSGAWYLRKVLPYRTSDNGVEGVVITFVDITEGRRAAGALTAAKGEAELATVAKSRFLAAASHDLRQPLQTLALIQGLLAKTVEGEKPRKLVSRLEETLAAMTGMLNTLLDINQIDAGVVRAEPVDFTVGDLVARMKDEFTYLAQAKRLKLRAVRSSCTIHSDPALLEQIIRNFLSNALKYTDTGKILIGSRRHGDMLRIGVWDTGIGIPERELGSIFDEYHQLDNDARERSRGLGLGLSIVKRLGDLLGHRVTATSVPGRGSVFTIEVPLALHGPVRKRVTQTTVVAAATRKGSILIVEDDPQVRGLLDLYLMEEGHRTVTAHDGQSALAAIERGGFSPDLVLADFNLPNGRDGLDVAMDLRARVGPALPVIILTGDISSQTLRRIAQEACLQLHKPVKLTELTQSIQTLLPTGLADKPPLPVAAALPKRDNDGRMLFVVDDDRAIRDAIQSVFEEVGWTVETHATSESFLAAHRPGQTGCLVIDAYLPGMTGMALLQRLHETGERMPAVMITGDGDVTMAVSAMKAGASDFIEKPIGMDHLIASVEHTLEHSRDTGKMSERRRAAAVHVAELTPRQREIMDLVLAGHPSKNIAADLGISQRTVENHRASIMRKTGSKSVPALARLAMAAAGDGQDG